MCESTAPGGRLMLLKERAASAEKRARSMRAAILDFTDCLDGETRAMATTITLIAKSISTR